MYWYKKVILHYLDFTGRARRTEYWMYTLFNMLFFFVTIFLDMTLGLAVLFDMIGYFTFSYYIFVIIPTIAVTVRRLHDLGKSGWYVLVQLIPYVGGALILLAMCLEGQRGSNKWGPDPKEGE